MKNEIDKFIHMPLDIMLTYALRLGVRLVLPISTILAGAFKGDKEKVRSKYVYVNNKLVKYQLQKEPFSRMLILLPHCMQNKNCSRKVSEDINNCRRCGGCSIGEIAGMVETQGIKTVVAKGGTAARNTVKEFKPDLILAVACERELLSGIADVGKIPVIGVINQRPDGYCTNTTVDTIQLKNMLEGLLETSCRNTGTGFQVKGPEVARFRRTGSAEHSEP